MFKLIRAISESMSKSIQVSGWACISVWIFPGKGNKGLGGLVREDSKEGIVKIEHRKEGSRRGDREEECGGVVTTGRREQRLS